MAFPKLSRPGERRGPSTYLLITGSVFMAFFLIAVWVFSAPAEISEPNVDLSVGNTPVDTAMPTQTLDNTHDKVITGDESLKDSPGSQEGESTEAKDGLAQVPSDVVQKEEPAKDILDKTTKDPPATETNPDETDKKMNKAKTDDKLPDSISSQAEITKETKESKDAFETQATESKEEKKNNPDGPSDSNTKNSPADTSPTGSEETVGVKAPTGGGQNWVLCTMEGAQDYIPCLDNKDAIKKLPTTKHYEHRERHCPTEEELPKCLVPLPKGYKVPIKWPTSRDQIWKNNVPHTGLVTYKKDQNWVKLSADNQKLIFPGGGTQFKHGVNRYIKFIEQAAPDIAWGRHSRVILDVGCGVASFGGYLFDKDVLVMSLAPKDEHEAQVQLALERGIPAISAVMGTQRLVFPSNVFDIVHCARCRVPWEKDGGMLLLELNRVLRPGGYFVWSATPVYWHDEESQKIWKDTIAITTKLSWTLITRANDNNGIGVAIFQKPKDNHLYDLRKDDTPPFCDADDKPDAAWYVPMKACIHKLPIGEEARGTVWPAEWPLRVEATPSWLNATTPGIYGKPAAEDYRMDTDHWKRVIEKSYLQGLGINWDSIRNVMDMKAGYGGFAAALIAQQVWVMNIVPITEPDTLPIIFDRGFIGMYHDWCEPHSTYPRSYDLMHADHILSTLTMRCNIVNVVMEMDRILRPEGWAIYRDTVEVLSKVEETVKSLHWEIILSYTQGQEKLLVAQKRFWRPDASS